VSKSRSVCNVLEITPISNDDLNAQLPPSEITVGHDVGK
jgi:hypothetical protein